MSAAAQGIDPGEDAPLRVLRVYHSGVVGPWRDRDRALAAEGIEVTLISPRRWNEGGRDVDLVAGRDEHVVAARTFGRHPYRFAFDPRPLWRALRAVPFDVVDVHEEPASLAAAEVLLLARLAGRRPPICLYCAQNIEKRYPFPFRWFERRALRRAAAVHTCNDEAGHILRRKGFDGRIENLGLGVASEAFVAARSASPRPDTLRLGYVGRLEVHKGVGVLLSAMAELNDLDVDLVIVGDGPERPALDRQVAEAGLTGRVHLVGFRPSERVADAYAAFDVLVVPSLETAGWVEQFGRVAVEAMAAGVPVVASDSGSLGEVVGDAGLLVPPGDPTALATAIRGLASDPAARAQLSERARERAERWSWPEVARRQAALYREVAG